MKKLTTKFLSIALALILAMGFNACKDEEMTEETTVVDIALENGFTVLAAALTEADLITTLQGPGPFTVFAPTDAAFNAAGITADNVGQIAGLSDILLYHVLSGKVLSTGLSSGEVTMANGASATIDASAPSIEGANIITPFDVEADNGVVHTIDAVIIPPLTIVQTAVNAGYNVLAAGLVATGLDDALSGAGPFTVFAPTDAAFNAAGLTVDNIGSVDGLADILLYHVVSGTVTSGDLTTGDVETLNGKFIAIDAQNLTVDDANISNPFDVAATNGVIHTIDDVLMPMNNIVEAASATESLSTLVSVLGNYDDLVLDLSNEAGTYTVFAPTNDAFTALLAVIGQTDIADVPADVVRSILEYHVLASEVYSTDLSDGLTATTLNGEDVMVTADGGSFLIGGQGINTADVMTSNGVVHILDGVLVPASIAQFVNTIVEPAYFNNSFTTLIAAVQAASPSILETLLGQGPSGAGMTLFAPTNDAFTAAGITELPDQATLDAVLTYHLIDGIIGSGDLPSTQTAAPAAVTTVGGDFYLSNNGGGVFINGNTQVTATDISADNGVVHVINQTLLPPSQDIVAIAIDAGFNELAAALTEAGLVTTLQGAGPFTVFAPTDAAFTQLYTDLGVADATEVDDATLEAVLLYHVLGARVFSTDLADALEATSLSNDATFTVNVGETVTITDGNADTPDATVDLETINVLGTNGVIHIIDRVILPN